MMTSSVEDNWPWEFGSHPRRSASGDTKTKQEDLLDLITALLKFNCFLSIFKTTTVCE